MGLEAKEMNETFNERYIELILIMSDEAESEIYRVNKLLAIEDLDWTNQLEKVVGFLLQPRSRLPSISWIMQNNWFPFLLLN